MLGFALLEFSSLFGEIPILGKCSFFFFVTLRVMQKMFEINYVVVFMITLEKVFTQ